MDEKKKQIICYECHEPGHKRPDCPRKKAKAALTALKPDNDTQVEWYIDSGATNHMTSNTDILENIRLYNVVDTVTVANGEKLICKGVGDMSFISKNGEGSISDVVIVPNINCNLLSFKKAADKGLHIVFHKNGCKFYKDFSCKGTLVLSGSVKGGLYTLGCDTSLVASSVRLDTVEFQLWHKRLGHLCRIGMDQLRKGEAIGVDYKAVDLDPCVSCLEGKKARKSFKKINYDKGNSMLELIHADLCGPMSENSFEGNKYLLMFTDDYSRTIFAFYISSKKEVTQKFRDFQMAVELEKGFKIKRLRTDNGTEFVNRDMREYLNSKGIKHETTVPYSPQQNGIAERTNRSIIEKARSMLAESNLSKAYWQDAVATAVYLKNRSPHRALNNQTPFFRWHGQKPNLSHLKVFGCRAMVQVPDCQRRKLDLKATEHIFVGYTSDPQSYIFRNSLYPRRSTKARDVTFFENKFTSLKNNEEGGEPIYEVPYSLNSGARHFRSEDVEEQAVASTSGVLSSVQDEIVSTVLDCVLPDVNIESLADDVVPSLDDVQNESSEVFDDALNEEIDTVASVIQPEHTEVSEIIESEADLNADISQPFRRYPLRDRKPKDFGPDFLLYKTSFEEIEGEGDESLCYSEALSSDNKEEWLDAMNKEYMSLLKKNTWILVHRPNSKKVIKCKWVYKLKRDAEGNPTQYKARLVAKDS